MCAMALQIVRGPAAAASEDSPLVFGGNRLFGDDVLSSIVNLPQGAVPDEVSAAYAAERIVKFYRARDYDLVRVWTKIHEKRLYIAIDEGVIDQTLYFGRGSVVTVFMHLFIKLPENVYNRPMLIDEISRVKNDLSISNVYYEIQPCAYTQRIGDLFKKDGKLLFNETYFPHKLNVYILSIPKGGPGFGLDYLPQPGAVPFVYMKGLNFLDEDDNYLLQAEGGINLRKSLVDDKYRLVYTHTKGIVHYESKPFFDFFRIITDNFIDLSSFQRNDLPLDQYWHFTVHGSLNAGFQIRPGFMVSLGGGAEYYNIFGLETVPDDSFDIEPFHATRGFGELRLDFDITPERLRLDKHDFLSATYQYFEGKGQFHRGEVTYWRFMEVGADDFYLRVKGLTSLGDPRFHDERALGGLHMRTFHQGKFYVDHALWLSLEYRFAVYRDRIKLSLFHDAAFFGQIDRTKTTGRRGEEPYEELEESTRPALANSFGPGFHWLIFDTFQWDVYLCTGFSPAGFSWNVFLRIYKVYF